MTSIHHKPATPLSPNEARAVQRLSGLLDALRAQVSSLSPATRDAAIHAMGSSSDDNVRDLGHLLGQLAPATPALKPVAAGGVHQDVKRAFELLHSASTGNAVYLNAAQAAVRPGLSDPDSFALLARYASTGTEDERYLAFTMLQARHDPGLVDLVMSKGVKDKAARVRYAAATSLLGQTSPQAVNAFSTMVASGVYEQVSAGLTGLRRWMDNTRWGAITEEQRVEVSDALRYMVKNYDGPHCLSYADRATDMMAELGRP